MPTRTLGDVETELRRATIAARLADDRCDARRLVAIRERQDQLLDEWKQLAER